MQELNDRVAVVTGGASGIGFGLATAFAAEGMKIVLGDIEAPALDDAVEKLQASGAEVIGVRTDVSDAAQVQASRRRRGRAVRRASTSRATTRVSARADCRGKCRSTRGSGCSAPTCGASSTACARSFRS